MQSLEDMLAKTTRLWSISLRIQKKGRRRFRGVVMKAFSAPLKTRYAFGEVAGRKPPGSHTK